MLRCCAHFLGFAIKDSITVAGVSEMTSIANAKAAFASTLVTQAATYAFLKALPEIIGREYTILPQTAILSGCLLTSILAGRKAGRYFDKNFGLVQMCMSWGTTYFAAFAIERMSSFALGWYPRDIILDSIFTAGIFGIAPSFDPKTAAVSTLVTRIAEHALSKASFAFPEMVSQWCISGVPAVIVSSGRVYMSILAGIKAGRYFDNGFGFVHLLGFWGTTGCVLSAVNRLMNISIPVDEIF